MGRICVRTRTRRGVGVCTQTEQCRNKLVEPTWLEALAGQSIIEAPRWQSSTLHGQISVAQWECKARPKSGLTSSFAALALETQSSSATCSWPNISAGKGRRELIAWDRRPHGPGFHTLSCIRCILVMVSSRRLIFWKGETIARATSSQGAGQSVAGPPQAALPDAVMAPQSSIQITVLALETVMYPKKPLPRSLLGSESMTGRQA